MIPWVDISAEAYLEWGDVRDLLAEAIAEVTKPNVTGTRIYPNWIYEVDPTNMLGKITAPMKATSGTHNGLVKCWTIGIADAVYLRNQGGNIPNIGGQQWTWRLTFDVWGLFENDGTGAAERAAENEARLLSAFIFRNAREMVAYTPHLSKVGELEFSAVQPTPFSDGTSPIVASGRIQADINEAITI